MRTIVAVLIALAIASVALVSVLFQNPFPETLMGEQGKDGVLYLYLFKENSALRDSGIGGYYMLYDEMRNGEGQITKPSFEQVHYGIGKDGVYRNYLSDERIERFNSVKMIISDSIKKPDNSPLRQEDFAPDARFVYSPYYRATLAVEDDGTVYVMNQDRYENPNNLPPERMIGVVMLPVEAADFQKINSQYDEIKEKIESYEPRQVQSPPAMIVRGEARDIFVGLMPPLELIGETSNGRANVPSAEPLGPDGYLNDTNRISLRLYHANIVSNGTEIVAVSVMNPSNEDTISVNQLYIEGYISLTEGAVESRLLDRPVISLPYNVIEPSTTRPMRIPPGESITAFLQPASFGMDFYGASACYLYAEKAKQQDTTNQYCFYSKQQ